MTLKEIADMIAGIGYEYCYYQFETGPNDVPPEPPYVCFYYPNDDDLVADNINYARINALIVELYTDEKDFDAEEAVEAALIAHELPFSKVESYIETERMYMITYRTEVVLTTNSTEGNDNGQ